ncbi:unnamed protein product [Symbiodinium natans]|uniref:Uncharacterized protein n=1 Tax=Symbiodinium natans TaxID=878477 RepID=A0A812L0J5_9DINO|nr:unnamed protein product [Symbiodinium natans]
MVLTREKIIGQAHAAGRLYERARGSPARGVLEMRADELCVDLADKIARQIEEEEKQATLAEGDSAASGAGLGPTAVPPEPAVTSKPSPWSVDYSRFDAILRDEDDSPPNQLQVRQIAHSLAGVVEDVKRLKPPGSCARQRGEASLGHEYFLDTLD